MENNSSAVAEMGDRLATMDTGRKVGVCCAPFHGGAGLVSILRTLRRLGRDLPPYQVES